MERAGFLLFILLQLQLSSYHIDDNKHKPYRFKISTWKQDKEEANHHISQECRRTSDKQD